MYRFIACIVAISIFGTTALSCPVSDAGNYSAALVAPLICEKDSPKDSSLASTYISPEPRETEKSRAEAVKKRREFSKQGYMFLVMALVWQNLMAVLIYTFSLYTGSLLLGLFIVSVFIAPVGEELLYRRMLYGKILRPRTGPRIALIISTLLFWIIHARLGGAGFASRNVLFLGMETAASYQLTKRLWVPILLHSLHNTVIMFGWAFPLIYTIYTAVLSVVAVACALYLLYPVICSVKNNITSVISKIRSQATRHKEDHKLRKDPDFEMASTRAISFST